MPTVSVAKQPGNLDLSNITGGEYWADSITVSGPNTLTSTLVLLAENRLEISGQITPGPRKPNDPVINITLACRSGRMEVGPSASVGGGAGSPGRSPPVATSREEGGNGANGGYLLLVGIDIHIKGKLLGIDGGSGGDVDVRGGPLPASMKNCRAGSGVAVGGCGGHGGAVVICASEIIELEGSAQVIGSRGGMGGKAAATVSNYGEAYGHGGHAGDSGPVILQGRGNFVPVRIPAGAGVYGGCTPLAAGTVTPRGGEADLERIPGDVNVEGSGGPATAIGGAGGDGGGVYFPNCAVEGQGDILSGVGMTGGPAESVGGAGQAGGPVAKDGGNADSNGGNGGVAGPLPQYRDSTGAQRLGTKGDDGAGGDAGIEVGDGGSTGPGGIGGKSGKGTATGGSNGAGKKATPKASGPANPIQNFGGAIGGGPVISAGEK